MVLWCWPSNFTHFTFKVLLFIIDDKRPIEAAWKSRLAIGASWGMWHLSGLQNWSTHLAPNNITTITYMYQYYHATTYYFYICICTCWTLYFSNSGVQSIVQSHIKTNSTTTVVTSKQTSTKRMNYFDLLLLYITRILLWCCLLEVLSNKWGFEEGYLSHHKHVLFQWSDFQDDLAITCHRKTSLVYTSVPYER